MEIFDRTEPLYKLFAERVGILSVLLPYFGYAHHGYQLLNKMWKGSRLLLDSNPFDKILKDIKMDYDLFVDKFDSIHKTITCIQHSYNSFVNTMFKKYLI